jgi:hypothetical protein
MPYASSARISDVCGRRLISTIPIQGIEPALQQKLTSIGFHFFRIDGGPEDAQT